MPLLMRKYLVEILKTKYQESPFFLLTPDIGFNLLEDLKDLMGKNFINVGISESNMISIAAGLSIKQKVVIVSISSFLVAKTLEQIKLDIDYHNANVIMLALGSNFYYGAQGYSHFSLDDTLPLLGLPNLDIFDPGATVELENIINFAFLKQGPSYIRIGRYLYDGKMNITPSFSYIGSGKVAIVSSGTVWHEYLKLPAKIISCFNIKRVSDIIPSLGDTVLVVEECSYPGIIAPILATTLLESKKRIKFKAISCHIDHNLLHNEKGLRKLYHLDNSSIEKHLEVLLRP